MARSDRTFDEWRSEVAKAPRSGGARTNLPVPSPGFLPPATGLGNPLRNKYNANPSDVAPSWIDDIDDFSFISPQQPMAPIGGAESFAPIEWDYQTGYNLNFINTRMEMMGMLRGMARTWGVLGAVINTKMSQLLRVPWTIQRRDSPKQSSRSVDQMKEFFRHPDGKSSHSRWAKRILDDLLVLDAPTIFLERDRIGRPLYAVPIQGSTIFPLIDERGRRPDTVVDYTPEGLVYLRRQPAFQQIIKGMPITNLDETQLMYAPSRSRPEMPMFGYPATEQILVETIEAILKTSYQQNFWKEGNLPDLIVTVPKDWTPKQIAQFSAFFDATYSGNLKLKSRVRFLPGDSKPFDIKNSSGESLWSQRDETLIRLVCYVYGVSHAPFVQMLNRSTAQAAQQVSIEEGLYPLMSYWKDDIMDPLIQEKFRYDDLEFVFQPVPEPNAEKQATIHQIQFRNGIRPINEIRDELGLEPVAGGDKPLLMIGNAIIPLEDAAAGLALPQNGGDGAPNDSTQTKPSATPSPPANSPIRGQPRARTDSPTPSVRKLSAVEVDDAAQRASGDVNNHSGKRLEAGNYPKGHLRLFGLDISIENAAFSQRGKKNADGTLKWSARMTAHYGYIRGTVGADGDQIDVYIGRRPDSKTVWVIDQAKITKKNNRKFDEHKVMLGYKSLRKALRDYRATHDAGQDLIDSVTEMTVDEFKTWLDKGKTHKRLEGQGYGTSVDLKKADTISSSTGLMNPRGVIVTPRRRRRRKRVVRGPRWLELVAS